MSRFNTAPSSTKTVNRAGGEAYSQDAKTELVSLLLTSFVQDQFYRSANESLDQVSNLIDTIKDKQFAAKAAVYARNKFGMRSISHVTAAEIVARVKGEDWTKDFIGAVVRRPDDLTEIYAYYLNKFGKPVPNSLKKGTAIALDKFDEYQIGKYRGDKNAVSLHDVVNLSHPLASMTNKSAITKLMTGDLRQDATWEAKLSATGNAETEEEKKEKKSDAWEDLISSKRIGYFALLKNLRNIIEQAPHMVDPACKLLTNEKMIKSSLVLPFRYVTAIKQIEALSGSEAALVLDALNQATEISLKNVPKYDGKTLIVLDSSGSMSWNGYGTDNKPTPMEIGSLFAAALYKTNDADFMTFANNAQYYSPRKSDGLLTVAERMSASGYNGGTNFDAPFEVADKAYDRIILLSDMQGWIGYNSPVGALSKYQKRTNSNPRIYSFDLQGYGTLEFPQSRVYQLAGFSDKIFDIMKMLETDRKAMVNEIEKVTF